MIKKLETQNNIAADKWPSIRTEALSLASELGKRAKGSITVPTDPESVLLRQGRNALVFGNQVGVDAPKGAALYIKFLLSRLKA
jgi:hypothetical protein